MSQVQTMISITLPDGSSRNVEPGSTCADLAKSISQGLGKKAVGATINGELRDLHTPLKDGDSVKILRLKTRNRSSIFATRRRTSWLKRCKRYFRKPR